METYKFNFDIDKAHALRDAINDREKFSIDSELEYERKKKDTHGIVYAWQWTG